MKIKLNTDAYGFKQGDKIEVSPTVGEKLIKDGDAELVEPRRSRKKPENKALSATS